MASYLRPPLPPGVTTLPARYYTDPEHFVREMERIHFDMWLCAGRLEQINTPGRYFVRRVGNASVIVLRSEDGRVGVRVSSRKFRVNAETAVSYQATA